ncbi:MAG: hypothetical protein WCK93_12470, partial [Nitrosomonadales bacterium]
MGYEHMTMVLRRIYDNLPGFRELRRLERRVTCSTQILQEANVIQALESLKAGNDRYRDPRRLLAHGAQCWSQNYEDGMIAEIFRRIKIKTKTFLEIGVGNGRENNTALLVATG